MRVFSFGGGVQSTAVLVLAAQGNVRYDHWVFSNVGEDSENPDTLTYIRDVARPFAERYGITIEEVRRPETLLSWTLRREKSIALPMYLTGGGPGNRECTRHFKIRLIATWLRQRGASRDNPAVLGLGISTDEFQRARSDSGFPSQTLEYPLLDRRISRADCLRLIADAGLPQPPKSACWFCPFHRVSDWRRMKHDNQDLFEQAVTLEKTLGDRRETMGRDRVYLTDRGRSLDLVVAGDQPTLDDALETCESGYCFT